LGYESLDGLGIRHVNDIRFRLNRPLSERLRASLGSLSIDINDRNRCAVLCKFLGDLSANALRRTRNDCRLVLE
jgi:hypothetical protein